MIKKLKELINSIRFWQVILAGGIAVLAHFGIISDDLRNILVGMIGVVVTIGSVERNLDKRNEATIEVADTKE